MKFAIWPVYTSELTSESVNLYKNDSIRRTLDKPIRLLEVEKPKAILKATEFCKCLTAVIMIDHNSKTKIV
jgi:hypothetical protein